VDENIRTSFAQRCGGDYIPVAERFGLAGRQKLAPACGLAVRQNCD